jgi:phosphate transport system substrate-binding protein
VADDPDGIGYSGFGYARAAVKTVALAESAGLPYYAGLPAEVARQDYPLSRSIYLGINAAPGTPLPPLLREFLRFVLSAEGQATVERDHMRFLPLDPARAAEARSAIP